MIRITNARGRTTFINPEHVVMISPGSEPGVVVFEMVGGTKLETEMERETVDRIVRRMEGDTGI